MRFVSLGLHYYRNLNIKLTTPRWNISVCSGTSNYFQNSWTRFVEEFISSNWQIEWQISKNVQTHGCNYSGLSHTTVFDESFKKWNICKKQVFFFVALKVGRPIWNPSKKEKSISFDRLSLIWKILEILKNRKETIQTF